MDWTLNWGVFLKKEPWKKIKWEGRFFEILVEMENFPVGECMEAESYYGIWKREGVCEHEGPYTRLVHCQKIYAVLEYWYRKRLKSYIMIQFNSIDQLLCKINLYVYCRIDGLSKTHIIDKWLIICIIILHRNSKISIEIKEWKNLLWILDKKKWY